MNISVVGKVSFTVAANNDVPREAELTFTRGTDKVTFYLTQLGAKEPEPTSSFSFDFVEIGDTYFKVEVTPDDMEMKYVVNVMDKAGFFPKLAADCNSAISICMASFIVLSICRSM